MKRPFDMFARRQVRAFVDKEATATEFRRLPATGEAMHDIHRRDSLEAVRMHQLIDRLINPVPMPRRRNSGGTKMRNRPSGRPLWSRIARTVAAPKTRPSTGG